MQKLSENNTQLQLKEEEAKIKDAEMREAVKRKTANGLEKEKARRQKDHLFTKKLEEFMDSNEVEEVFTRYGKFLDHMFKFYCLQAKADISKD